VAIRFQSPGERQYHNHAFQETFVWSAYLPAQETWFIEDAMAHLSLAGPRFHLGLMATISYNVLFA